MEAEVVAQRKSPPPTPPPSLRPAPSGGGKQSQDGGGGGVRVRAVCEARRQRLPDSAARLQSRLQVGIRGAAARAYPVGSHIARRSPRPLPPPGCHLARPRIRAVIAVCSLSSPALDGRRLCVRRLETYAHPARSPASSPGPVRLPRRLPIIHLQLRLLLRPSPSARSCLRPSVCHPHLPPFPLPGARVWITVAS